MKILFVSDLWYPAFPGGAERYISHVADALVERGHDIHILTSYAKAKSKHPITVADIGTGERHEHGACRIADAVAGYGPDVIFSHHFFAGAFAREFSNLKAIAPFIEIVHSRQRHPDASLAIFNSSYTASRCGYLPGDIIMLPPADNNCIATGDPFKRKYIGHIKPIPNLPYKGGWYGKGIDLTYRLARIMPQKKFLVLRGEWTDCEKIEILPNVEFVDPVDDIRDFYSQCRVIVMPSGSEDAGTVPLEAALNGIPCISSNVGGLVETNAAGLMFSPHEIIPWLKAITDLDDPKFYEQVVKRERTYINTIDWPKQFDRLNRKMEDLCAKSV